MNIALPKIDGSMFDYQLTGRSAPKRQPSAIGWNRKVYAAAHVVADPFSAKSPWAGGDVDWAMTTEFREYLWSLGFGIAEAMDTAQRGMGLSWVQTRRIIEITLAQANGRSVACGAGTDQLADGPHSISEVREAYCEQLEFIDRHGGQAILMASRALRACASGPSDYYNVYSHLIRQTSKPLILHWLGADFDPMLSGYWGSDDYFIAAETVLSIIRDNASKVDGIKISLLDANKEISFRRQLPENVRLYTGDDFNYPDLIAGDSEGYSDALLGILDPIAPVAAVAFDRLANGDRAAFQTEMDSTVEFSRHVFQAPTQFYKAGVVFLAWLNGHQNHFTMLGGLQSSRSPAHYSELFVLADKAGLLLDPDLARYRMANFLSVAAAA